jgi:hypothetical protein
MILKQCQLRDSKRLVRVAGEADLSSYRAKVAREERFLADAKILAADKRITMKIVRDENHFEDTNDTLYYTYKASMRYPKLVADGNGPPGTDRDAPGRAAGRDEDAGRHRPLRLTSAA